MKLTVACRSRFVHVIAPLRHFKFLHRGRLRVVCCLLLAVAIAIAKPLEVLGITYNNVLRYWDNVAALCGVLIYRDIVHCKLQNDEVGVGGLERCGCTDCRASLVDEN